MAAGTKAVRLIIGPLAIVLVLGGCAGHSWKFWESKAMQTPPETPIQVAAAEDPAPAPTPAPTASVTPTAQPVVAATTPAARSFVEMPTLGDVRFRTGLVTVGKTDAKALDTVARWLKENPGAVVRIEGHTDDLGTPVDNLAVGQKRAASAMKYLIDKGVSADRISIVSYGSDRPLCSEKNDACRARNRRVHFLVSQQH
jgi:peptidoglycan-associated lipoprotein